MTERVNPGDMGRKTLAFFGIQRITTRGLKVTLCIVAAITVISVLSSHFVPFVGP